MQTARHPHSRLAPGRVENASPGGLLTARARVGVLCHLFLAFFVKLKLALTPYGNIVAIRNRNVHTVINQMTARFC